MDASSWSTREKLAIASFITRLGDNEWVDADKFLEPFCEIGRPSDWLAATACAHQMKDLLEQCVSDNQNSTTTHDDILQSLTKTRIAELEQLISKQDVDCTRMRDELDLIESGSLDDELDELFKKISSRANKEGADHLQENADVDYDSKSREYRLSDFPDGHTLSKPTTERKCINNAHLRLTEAASPCVATHKSSGYVIPNESPSKTNHNHQVSIETSTPSPSARDKELASAVCAVTSLEPSNCDTLNSVNATVDVNPHEWRYENSDISKDDSQVSLEFQRDSPNLTNSSRQFVHSIGEDGGPNTSFTLRNSEILMNESSFGGAVASNIDISGESQIGAEIIAETEIPSPTKKDPSPDVGAVNNSGFRVTEKNSSKTEFDGETSAYKAWKKSTMILWNQIASHRYASIFMQPVTDEIAPNYSSTVYRAVDLSSIKRDVENGSLRSTSEFQRDLMLMFQNALMYNNVDHHVYKMASEMQSEVMDQVTQFLITQIMASRNRFNSASSFEPVADGTTICDRVISASTDALLSVLVTESRPKRAAAIDTRKKQL